MAARAAPFAQRALSAMMGTVNTLAASPATIPVSEAALSMATGSVNGAAVGVTAGAISMSRAIELGVAHVGASARVTVSGSEAFQFVSSSKNAAGQLVTKIARFDVNAGAKTDHVRKLGPHLNLETQINGKTVTNGPLKDPHIPINPATIRPGDIPSVSP